MIGLSFASEAEAKLFHATMVETITNRAAKRLSHTEYPREPSSVGEQNIGNFFF